jgi:hypothetical protein
MTKCVCIEMEDDGSISVGLEPTDMAEGGQGGGGGAEGSQGQEDAESSYMKPAKSLDDALQVAKDLLTSDQAQQAQDGPDVARQAMQDGFNGTANPQMLTSRGM